MPYSASQLTTFYSNANLGAAPSAAEALLIQAYAQQDSNGALTDAQTLTNVLTLSRDKTDVAVATYEFFTGTTPTLAGLSFLVHGGGNTSDLTSAYYTSFNTENRFYNFAINLAFGSSGAANFANTYGAVTFHQAVVAAYENIVGTVNVGSANAAAAIASIESSLPYFTALASQRAASLNQDLAVKAIMIGYILEEAVKADVGTYAKSLDLFMNSLATTATANTGDLLANYPPIPAGQTFALTAGVDNFSGGNGNDTVTSDSGAKLSGLDNLNGGGGANVLTITDTAAIVQPAASVTVTNFQTVNLTSGTSITLDATKNFTGVTQLNASSTGTATLTVAASTNVSSTAVGGSSVTGGANVTTADTGGVDVVSGAAGAISVTDNAQAANNVTVDGGTNVSVGVTGSTGGAIAVGGTTAPSGTVSVTEAVKGGAGNVVGATIGITGGTALTVNETLAGSTADVTKTTTAGAVTVTGTATTTSVSVGQTAAAAATAKVGQIIDSAVTINDVNGADLLKAGTITSVSLTNSASATITDNALATLSLSGTDGTVTLTNKLTTPTSSSLSLNLTNAKFALTDSNNEVTTLNVTTLGTGSTMTAVTDNKLATLNISGSTGGLTLGAALQASVTSLTVGGASSFNGDISTSGLTAFSPTSSGTVTVTMNATTQAFTGGAGTDVITTAQDTVKAVVGGSAGNNEIILNNSGAGFTGGHPANISGFQILGTQSASTGTFDLSKFTADAFSSIDVQATAGSTVFTKVTQGTSLGLTGGAAITGGITYQLADSSGATDQVNVTVGTAAGGNSAVAGQLTLEDNVLAGIGTVVISSVSKAPAALAANFVNTLGTLNDTGMTQLTFGGNADTTITTLVDNGSTVTVTNAGTATNLETITGWTDNNLKSLTLSGNVALVLNDSVGSSFTAAGASDNGNVTLNLTGAALSKVDSITLGTGTDVVSDANTGAVTITLAGATTGTDVVTVGASANANITANGGANTITASSTGVNTVIIGATGAKAESVSFGLGTNSATFGAHTGVDNVTVVAHNLVNPGAAGVFLSAVVTGLNSATLTNDTITFGTDGAAAGAVTVVSAATINAYANATGSDATQLATALNAVLDAGSGGAGLVQHHVAEFQFQGNTYIVEQADVTGHTLANEAANSLTIVELVGVVPITAAGSAAAAGVFNLHG